MAQSSNDNKSNLLLLAHFPPPLHGSSVMGKLILSSKVINDTFFVHSINLLVSKEINTTGQNSWKKIMDGAKIAICVIAKVIKQRPSLCYLALTATGLAFYRDAIIVSILKLFGLRRVYHLHNKGVASEAKKSWFKKALYKWVFSGAYVILLSRRLYDDIDEYVPSNRIIICANGIPDLSNNRAPSQRDNRVPVVLFLSNLFVEKGVYVLLEALSILKERKAKFFCKIVGDEGNISIAELTKLIEMKGLTEYIQILGKSIGQPKIDLFETSDIFVMPSLNECFPLVLLEALRSSLPVIATSEGGIPDIVEDGINGFLIKKNDSFALANYLQTLLSNSELRRQMGMIGRSKYEFSFSFDSFENNLVANLKFLAA
jgi:glycosyltransferase involved in cell wall biosynthesis